MNNRSYYVSKAPNPVELAELNVPFYNAFVQEMGCNRLYRKLWVGENLAALIQNIQQYKIESDEMENRKIKAVSQYEKFYHQLTGCNLLAAM